MAGSPRLPLVVGTLAVAAVVAMLAVASLTVLSPSAPQPAQQPTALLARSVSSRSGRRSTLPSRALAVMKSDNGPLSPARFQSLDCGCTDISSMWKGDNLWGHYKAMCCDKNAPKTLGSVLAGYIKQADDNDKKLAKFLKDAREKLNPKISLVVDAVTLKSAGRPGPVGPVGKKGPQGYAGLTGDQGPRGPDGIQGPVGPKGHPGQQGYRGETGDVGPKGVQGWEGPLGAPGYVGPDGPRGVVGVIGPPGPPGPQGPPGNQGGIGAIGNAGPMGPSGRQGGVIEMNAYKSASSCQLLRHHRLEYLDRQYVNCRGHMGDSYINFFRLGQYNCGGWDMKYRYTCVSPARFTKCGDEGGKCKCSGNVRFGSGNRWSSVKQVSTEIDCNARVFGDPWPNQPKHCECAAGPNLGSKDCETYYTPCNQVYGMTADWQANFKVACPQGKLLSHFRQVRGSCQGNHQQYQYTCCTPTRGYGSCRTVYSGCQHEVGVNSEYLDRVAVGCGGFEAVQDWQLTAYGCNWWSSRQYVSTCCILK